MTALEPACVSVFLAVLAGCARMPSSAARPVSVPSSPVPVASPLPAFSPGTADPARKAKLAALAPQLDALFREKMKAGGATGLAVGVVVDGELAYWRGFGVRDIAAGQPVDVDTVFRIASVTKGFTALAAMKLRDEGRLSLDVPAVIANRNRWGNVHDS
jgi:CubicO group peptidase (beta-lactamase class C family)